MNRKHFLSYLLLFCLVCSNLLVFVPESKAQTQNGSGNISFQRDIIDQVQFSYVNHAFVFSYGQYYLVFRPYFQYAGQIYTLQQALNFLQRQYPNAQYRQVLQRVARTIHWGFNYTNLPQAIQTNLQAIYLKLEDYNFPLSAIELETYQGEDLKNYTRILIPKANLAFDFGDIISQDFSVKVNRTGIAIYNVSGKANLNLDPITFSSPTVTVTGFTSSSPCTFWAIWNASYVGGWFIVNNKTNISPTTATVGWSQYFFECLLIIGDGSTATYFSDTAREAVWDGTVLAVAGVTFLRIKSSATVTFGVLLDATVKSSRSGCLLYYLTSSSYYNGLLTCDSGSTVYFYSCTFTAKYKANNNLGSYGVISGYPKRIWNCLFNDWQVRLTNCDVYDIIVSTKRGANDPAFFRSMGSGNTMDRIIIFSSGMIMSSDFVSSRTITNIVGYGNGYVFAPSNAGTQPQYIVNGLLDSWTFSWGAYSPQANIYRQYTYNLAVTYPNGTAIQNANVTLSKTTTKLSFLTFANGTIPQQTLTYGHYNVTGGNTIYDAGNWQLNITTTNPNYANYSGIFVLNEPKNWKIALQPTAIGTGTIGHSISFALGIALLAVVVTVSILVVLWKRRSD